MTPFIQSKLIGCAIALMATLTSFSLPARADDGWPRQPIKIVVPWPPGGVADFLGRLVASSLTKQLGQQVIVENKAGAGTNIGSDYVAKANPDGYTLLMASSNNAVNMSLYPANPYNTSRDFAPIALVGYTPMVMLANPTVPAKDLGEFINFAQANPAKITAASAGNGSPSHLAAAAFERSAKVKLVHVPYKGAGPAVTDLLGGQVQVLFTNVAASIAHIRGGKLKAYAITGQRRNPALPEVRTFAEGGLTDYDSSGWYGLVAPRQSPAPVLQRLSEAMAKTMSDPAFVERLAQQGVELPAAAGPQEFAKLINKDIDRYRRLISDSGIKPE
ncbi:Bug family tripartite tricarboxylate transporter substrate binding protein [Caenimonas soli]|uniref:Bug family tripartite tricarboxylate transporter substrate binding protein n=1 Tax=Caenimonas soli TaxID=2735555 RepID=UPI001556249A|nr:tripartite tricarboxylate transporter substrate binding protein [Caenimonas soli]NPC59116.1 tripartite tricarboxylate transporter substrate binding protein [Caenimonas soli]